MEKQTTIIILLGILLLGAISYIGYGQYGKWQQNKQITAYATFQQGAQVGVYQTVGQLFTEALKCDLRNGVPVTFQNQTIHVVALECIAAQQQAQQQQGQQGYTGEQK